MVECLLRTPVRGTACRRAPYLGRCALFKHPRWRSVRRSSAQRQESVRQPPVSSSCVDVSHSPLPQPEFQHEETHYIGPDDFYPSVDDDSWWGDTEEGVESFTQPAVFGNMAERLANAKPPVPVYLMNPLSGVWIKRNRDTGRLESGIPNPRQLEAGFTSLRSAGIHGVMVDVWWGIVEREEGVYDFGAYRQLFEMLDRCGLKVQAVMAFHAVGGNVGDGDLRLPLPRWVLDIGDRNPDIFYRDKQGTSNREYVSLAIDNWYEDSQGHRVCKGHPEARGLLNGRTARECYRDFCAAFLHEFRPDLGRMVTEVTVGLGPAGEMRYGAYPGARWTFPGIGQFQCHDKYMRTLLREHAEAAGHADWGLMEPHDSGYYNSHPAFEGFWNSSWGRFDSEYGVFFLRWYSDMLIRHADGVLSDAHRLLQAEHDGAMEYHHHEHRHDGATVYRFKPTCRLGIKLAGIHWWYNSCAHPAECTAGYYNTREHDGYRSILQMARKHDARVSLTCVEMKDWEHPSEFRCSPEGLFKQLLGIAQDLGVDLCGENALQRYDSGGLVNIVHSAFGQSASEHKLAGLTFLRMSPHLFESPHNWREFCKFLSGMCCPPDDYVRNFYMELLLASYPSGTQARAEFFEMRFRRLEALPGGAGGGRGRGRGRGRARLSGACDDASGAAAGDGASESVDGDGDGDGEGVIGSEVELLAFGAGDEAMSEGSSSAGIPIHHRC
ncbi:unnamed protein product [Pedinophyceae sp. YPF-701]|nr:unnamed protein product [Pedinophyceae sp. YPF-701]